MYLVSGEPGTGKTTLGFHFLEAGLENGETVLFVHGEETAEEILTNAAQFDIDLSRANFLDLGPDSDFFTADESYDLVNLSDVEEVRYTEAINDAIREADPSRVVIDPLTQLRYTESSQYHYRKRILSFMRFLKQRDITVLATATMEDARNTDAELRSLSDGVIQLFRTADGRRIEVRKNRGLGQRDGDHGLEIRASGLEVFPAVRPEPNDREFDPRQIPSGIPELESLTGGGFERGTVTFISGPPGIGKSTLSTLYLTQAAGEMGNAAIYLFEERLETFLHRCRSLNIPVEGLRNAGKLSITTIDPLSLSAEEFAQQIIQSVETDRVETVLIDGFAGYLTSVQGSETGLRRSLHSLTRCLTNREVSVFITDSTHQITGLSSATSTQISPIADNLLFLSYVETGGSLQKVIGVLKKRVGGFEYAIREFEITPEGIRVGGPVTEFSGVLQGMAQGHTTGKRGTDSQQ